MEVISKDAFRVRMNGYWVTRRLRNKPFQRAAVCERDFFHSVSPGNWILTLNRQYIFRKREKSVYYYLYGHDLLSQFTLLPDEIGPSCDLNGFRYLKAGVRRSLVSLDKSHQ